MYVYTLISYVPVKFNHFYSFTTTALVLEIQRKFICRYSKKQTIYIYIYIGITFIHIYICVYIERNISVTF